MEKPLWMPEGSVRSLLALGLVGGVIVLAVYLVIEHVSEDITQMVIGGLVAAMGSAVTHYFNVRQDSH